MAERGSVKSEARHLVEQLPDDATWDDVLYHLSVRRSIEAGLQDCREGRTISASELRQRLGLPNLLPI